MTASKSCDSCEVESPREDLYKKIATGISGAATAIGFSLQFLGLLPSFQTPLFLLAITVGGIYVVRGAWNGLTKKRFLNIDFLVVVAAIGALYLGEFGEGAAVVFFFSLAEAFEQYGIARSRKALENLVEKSPKLALLADGTEVPVASVTIGTVIAVKPGKLIPLDGKVLKGDSAVNEASITGEPLPQGKTAGDTVYAGTLNENGYLEIEVTKVSTDSTLAKIVKLVEEAQDSKTGAEEFIDSFAKYYTPAVAFIALGLFAIPTLFFGGEVTVWLERAITLLVIACPCALVIATPVAVTAALGGASRKGVLIRGGRFLEELGRVKAISLDKTGTLTEGEPRVSDVVAFDGFTEQQVLEDVAGIESYSSHPLSKAILALKYIEDMETEVESPVVITQRGGKGGGGGSRLSETGKSLTWEYIKLSNVIRKHRVVNEISGLVSEIDEVSRIIKIVLDSMKISIPLTEDLDVGDAVLILISPDDIMVMLEPQPSSLRNVFPCEIVGMELKEGTVRLTVTLDGISLMVDITEYSREKLDLNLGKKVYIGFKAASISVIKIS